MVERSLDYAMAEVTERGFTQEHSRSDSGKTIFMQKPGAETNRLGWPDEHAELHFHNVRGWDVTFCGREGRFK